MTKDERETLKQSTREHALVELSRARVELHTACSILSRLYDNPDMYMSIGARKYANLKRALSCADNGGDYLDCMIAHARNKNWPED